MFLLVASEALSFRKISKALFIAAALLWSAAPLVKAQVYAYEGFNYATGTALNGQNGGTGFASAYAPRYGSSEPSVAAGSLSDNGLATSGNSASLFPSGGFGELRRSISAFPQADGTTAYASFVLKPGTASGLAGIEIGNIGSDSTTLFVGVTGGNASNGTPSTYHLEGLFGSSGSSDTGVPAVTGQLTLVVLRFDFLAGNDQVSMYINPTPGDTEPLTANAVKSDVDFYANLNFFGLIGNDSSLLDEFRLGASFADVTPVPEPATYFAGFGCVVVLCWKLRRQCRYSFFARE